MSAARLAERLTEHGVKWDRYTVTKLENGKRQNVTVAELFALAYVLSVAPVHLVVPPLDGDDTTTYQLTGAVTTTPGFARAWIRGQTPIGRVEARRYFSEVPNSEWKPPAGQWAPENIESQTDAVRRPSDG